MKTRCQCPKCKVELLFDNSTDRSIKCPKCGYTGRTADFEEVKMKEVFCPNCDASVSLKADRLPKVITCPKCKCTEVTSKYSDQPKAKNNNGWDEENTETKTKTSMGMGKIYKPGKLCLITDDGCWTDDNKTIELKRGTNTLGRKSPRSTATLQLPTSDSYISRTHATIEVTMKADATFEHCISDNGSTNGTFHNGQRLEAGDINVLIPDDKVRLGHSTFQFIVE